jgi:hypothetical protein
MHFESNLQKNGFLPFAYQAFAFSMNRSGEEGGDEEGLKKRTDLLKGELIMSTSRILTAIALAGIILTSLLCGDLNAASVVGTYNGTTTGKFSVQGFFTDGDSGSCVIKLLKNKKFKATDNEGYSYTGKYKLLNKGKKIQFKFSNKSRKTFQKMLAAWAKDYAADEGSKLKKAKVNITNLTASKVAVKKGKPKQLTIKMSGTISGVLDGQPVYASFTYVTKVKFGKKI